MRIGPGIQVGVGNGTGGQHIRSPDSGTSRFGFSVFSNVLTLDERDFVRVG